MKIQKMKGFTLIEFVSVAAIILVLTAITLAGAADSRDSGKSSQFRSQYTQMVNNIAGFYQPDFNFTGLTTQVAVQGNLVPKEMQRDDGAGTFTVQPPWGSASCTVAVDSARTDLFTITCTGMPIDSCAKDIVGLDRTALRIAVGAAVSSLADVKDLTAATPVELNKSTLATTCGGFGNVPTYAFRATHRS